MSWYKLAQTAAAEQIVAQIKRQLRTSPFFLELLKEYHIPPEDVDNHLRIRFADLQGKFAEGNGEEIIIDEKLLRGDFFRDNMHYVVHEFFHWLKRRAEAIFYFNDDEEIQAFTLAIAFEILGGRGEDEIMKKLYPIISGHFENDLDAQNMFAKMLIKGTEIAQKYL